MAELTVTIGASNKAERRVGGGRKLSGGRGNEEEKVGIASDAGGEVGQAAFMAAPARCGGPVAHCCRQHQRRCIWGGGGVEHVELGLRGRAAGVAGARVWPHGTGAVMCVRGVNGLSDGCLCCRQQGRGGPVSGVSTAAPAPALLKLLKFQKMMTTQQGRRHAPPPQFDPAPVRPLHMVLAGLLRLRGTTRFRHTDHPHTPAQPGHVPLPTASTQHSGHSAPRIANRHAPPPPRVSNPVSRFAPPALGLRLRRSEAQPHQPLWQLHCDPCSSPPPTEAPPNKLPHPTPAPHHGRCPLARAWSTA